MLGTPYYMSPEQTRGTRAVDHRADLWALAVIVFQCMTGRLPFLSEALGDLLFKIAIEPLPVPSQVAPDVPPGFDAWWVRAAMRDPAQRFQTARDLVDALALCLGLSSGLAASCAGGGAWAGGASIASGASGAPGTSGTPAGGDGSLANSRPPSGAGGMGTPQPSLSGSGPNAPSTVAIPSMQSGISAQSMAEAPVTRSAVLGSAPPNAPSTAPPAPRGRGAGVLAAVAGAIVAGGVLAYVLLGRPAHGVDAAATTAPGLPSQTASPATATPPTPSVAPDPPAAPSTAAAPPSEPTIAPAASAALPIAAGHDGGAAPTPPGKPGGAKGGRSPGGTRTPPPPGPKTVPDYGI
jgi:serine/threonine-protein kinase